MQAAEAVALAMLAVSAMQDSVQPLAAYERANNGGRVRYGTAQLKATLAMMGCKTRHAHKVGQPDGSGWLASYSYGQCWLENAP